MKRIVLAAAVAVAALVVSAAPAMAQTTVVSPSPDPGSMGTLSALLGSLYPTSTLVRVSDGSDQVWVSEAGNASATARFAGFTNTFGYISGPSGGSFSSGFVMTGGNGPVSGPTLQAALPTPGATFRMGLSTPIGLWSSLDTDNSDGLDHMVTYYVSGGSFVGDYVVAFEDLSGPLHGAGGSDRDFNDLIVTIAGARPTPEPGTLLLFGSAAAGLYAWTRRNRKVVNAA